jgi:hypothetical protein
LRIIVGLATFAANLSLIPTTCAQDSPQYISFDAPHPGATEASTYPAAINRHGWIAGTVDYGSGVSHGFIRMWNGAFIAVAPPNSRNTVVTAINAYDEVVGKFESAGRWHGFLRNAVGKYTVLDAPGASATFPTAINGTEVIVGYATDASGAHGFLWDAQNGYTVFDVPGAQDGTTYAIAINGGGIVTGSYIDKSVSATRGFIRSRSGHYLPFDARGGGSGTYTLPVAINAYGQIAGTVSNDTGGTDCFFRYSNGTFVLFGEGEPGFGCTATAMNNSGAVVGSFSTEAFGDYAVEYQSGNFGPIPLPFFTESSIATGIDLNGHITGSYNGHGWVKIQ